VFREAVDAALYEGDLLQIRCCNTGNHRMIAGADIPLVLQQLLFPGIDLGLGKSLVDGDVQKISKLEDRMPSYFEFFCGGGMARAGLGPAWECRLANDIDPLKTAVYGNYWGSEHVITADVASLRSEDFRGAADLAWASFPCQDLSLAGNGAGINGARSGAFWSFWKQIEMLKRENRAPDLVVLENVCGTLTANEGKDFVRLADTLAGANYRFGAVIIDAVCFLPQSRPRLFLIAARDGLVLPGTTTAEQPIELWHSRSVREAHARLSMSAKNRWIWWKFPPPPARTARLCDVLETEPAGVDWHTPDETDRLLSLMCPLHRERVAAAQRSGALQVGAIYKRTRVELGVRRQRAEVRFDNIAGCLRTPGGGSSRQVLLFVDGERIRSRLLSVREAARLMGLPDEYPLPSRYNDGYHVAGDGVAVPVVRFLAKNILEPIVQAQPALAQDVA
jgi:DNA (cytosine-5)-methyltransferase 1